MAIKPLGHRVLVKPDSLEDSDPTYKSLKAMGFERAPSEDLRREQVGIDKGMVLALGATAFNDFGGEPWCEVGAYVAYARHSGKFITDPESDEKYLLLNDEDLICEITKKESKDD
jgi:co-chaperonin GroES (HSP10)